MKRSWTLSIGVCIIAMSIAAPLAAHAVKQKKLSAAERRQMAEVMMDSNLDQLPIAFPNSQRAKIKRLIWEQLTNGRRGTEATLGRAKVYFPVFEHYLRVYGLPEELKCIPFVESRLRLQAQSPAGARGLWQFMDYTARAYQLNINEMVDERLDPLRSTEAAMRFLTSLYDEFGDWLLALAAYNCGPGNVRKAMRLAGSRNYWKLEQYLPSQTRHYIPAFIATAYIVQHYEQHGLQPRTYNYRFAHLRALPVHTAAELSPVAQLPQRTMRLPNPGYAQEVIPSNVDGNYLVLPGFKFPDADVLATENIVEVCIAPAPKLHSQKPIFSWQVMLFPQKTFFDHVIAYISNSAGYFGQTPRRM